MQKILMKYGTIKKLAIEMGVNEKTVREALRFVTEGDQPDLIRRKAVLEYGGVPLDTKRGRVFTLK